jgi:hypothetical protein
MMAFLLEGDAYGRQYALEFCHKVSFRCSKQLFVITKSMCGPLCDTCTSSQSHSFVYIGVLLFLLGIL